MKKEYLLKIDESHPSSADFIKFVKSLDFVKLTRKKKSTIFKEKKKDKKE